MAVPRPVVWILPHSLHLSQPTQSIIRLTFLKCCLNSSLRTWAQSSEWDDGSVCVYTYVGVLTLEKCRLIELARELSNFKDLF